MKREPLLYKWIPFVFDGYEVEVFFPKAHTPEGYVETEPKDIEQTLITAYQKSETNKSI